VGANPPPGRMARAMTANLGEGANSRGAKFAILGRGPTATYDFIKAKIAILGRGASFGGGQVCNSWGGGQRQEGGGICAGGGEVLRLRLP
jgi:hypothetical protein